MVDGRYHQRSSHRLLEAEVAEHIPQCQFGDRCEVSPVCNKFEIMASMRTLVTTTAVTQLLEVSSRSVRPSSGTKSAFLPPPSAVGKHHSSSLHFKDQRIHGVGSFRVPVRASASSAADPTKGTVTKSLEGIQVSDTSGGRIFLTSLWENRKAVIAFTRHFGCVLCRKKAALLEARKAEFDAAGVALVLIAPGLPEQAKLFLEKNKFTGEVYADPDYAAYKALDVERGVLSVINPKSGLRVLQALSEGWKMDWKLSAYKDTIQSGAWLQGGILVAGPGKDNVHYFVKDAEAGDEPNMNEVMSAC